MRCFYFFDNRTIFISTVKNLKCNTFLQISVFFFVSENTFTIALKLNPYMTHNILEIINITAITYAKYTMLIRVKR